MQHRTALVALVWAASAAPAAGQAFFIDAIRDDPNPANGVDDAAFSLSTPSPLVTDVQAADPADVFGGVRAVSLERDGGFGGSISAERALGSDVISVMNGNVAAGTLVLGYSGTATDFASFGNAIAVDLPTLDNAVGDGEINLSVTLGSGSDSFTVFADGTGLAPGRIEDPGVFLFSLADFAGVDLTAVDAVSVTFETAIIGSDFTIRSISVVPAAPAAALLAPLGVLAARRRRG